jgi:hypothetical protein
MANVAEEAAVSAYTVVLAMANARRWDSGVVLILGAYLADYCSLLLVW